MNNMRSFFEGKRTIFIAGIVIIIIAAVSLIILLEKEKLNVSRERHERSLAAKAGPQVFVTAAKRLPGGRSITLTGEARPYASVTLYAKVSGYIKSIPVDKGDHLKEGQVVAVIESPELDSQYKSGAGGRTKQAPGCGTGKVAAREKCNFHSGCPARVCRGRPGRSQYGGPADSKRLSDHPCAVSLCGHCPFCRSRRPGSKRRHVPDNHPACRVDCRDSQNQGVRLPGPEGRIGCPHRRQGRYHRSLPPRFAPHRIREPDERSAGR